MRELRLHGYRVRVLPGVAPPVRQCGYGLTEVSHHVLGVVVVVVEHIVAGYGHGHLLNVQRICCCALRHQQVVEEVEGLLAGVVVESDGVGVALVAPHEDAVVCDVPLLVGVGECDSVCELGAGEGYLGVGEQPLGAGVDVGREDDAVHPCRLCADAVCVKGVDVVVGVEPESAVLVGALAPCNIVCADALVVGVVVAVEAVCGGLPHGVAVDGEGCGRHVGCGACHARYMDVVCASLDPVADEAYLLHELGAAGGVVVPDCGFCLDSGVGGLYVAVADEYVADHAFECNAALRLGCVAECHPVEDPVHGVLEGGSVGAVVEADDCSLVGGYADGAGCA